MSAFQDGRESSITLPLAHLIRPRFCTWQCCLQLCHVGEVDLSDVVENQLAALGNDITPARVLTTPKHFDEAAGDC